MAGKRESSGRGGERGETGGERGGRGGEMISHVISA